MKKRCNHTLDESWWECDARGIPLALADIFIHIIANEKMEYDIPRRMFERLREKSEHKPYSKNWTWAATNQPMWNKLYEVCLEAYKEYTNIEDAFFAKVEELK